MEENRAIFLHIVDLIVNLIVHVTCIVLLANFAIDLQLEIHVVRIFDLLLTNEVSEDQEAVLYFGLEPWCTA